MLTLALHMLTLVLYFKCHDSATILKSLVSLERRGKNYTTCVQNLDEESQSTCFLLHDLVTDDCSSTSLLHTTYLGIQFTLRRYSKSSVVALDKKTEVL